MTFKRKIYIGFLVLNLVLIFVLSDSIDKINLNELKEENTQTPEYLYESQVIGEQTENQENDDLFLVTRVVDGDTIEIDTGDKVRYIGIDTPETNTKIADCYAFEAKNENKMLVENKYIKMEKDISDKDRYGRLLRYVWVGDVFVNDYLVKEGFAKSYSYPPDIKYQEMFVASQNFARENNKGLWGSCN